MAAGSQIKGHKRFYNLHEEATRVGAHAIVAEYDSDEWSSGIVAVESQKNRGGSALFVNVPIAHRVLIRSDKDIVVRWNSASAPPVTIEAGVAFEETRLEITDIFLTTTATTGMKVYTT